jgi:hypothetical protein
MTSLSLFPASLDDGSRGWRLAPLQATPKRAGVHAQAKRSTTDSELKKAISDDSINECPSEIDEMVPRGLRVSDIWT